MTTDLHPSVRDCFIGVISASAREFVAALVGPDRQVYEVWVVHAQENGKRRRGIFVGIWPVTLVEYTEIRAKFGPTAVKKLPRPYTDLRPVGAVEKPMIPHSRWKATVRANKKRKLEGENN